MGGGLSRADTPRRYRVELVSGDCPGDEFVIDSQWSIYAASSGESAELGAFLTSGAFLMGCEDEFPPLSVTSASIPFGSFLPGDVATDTTGRVIALATYGELAGSATNNLAMTYGFSPAWWDTLDDPEDEQAYIVAYDRIDEKVLIVGASRQGLQFGLVDFLKSLDEVKFDPSASGWTWSPDPVTASTTGAAVYCKDYNSTCGAGGTPCYDTGLGPSGRR